MKVPAAMQWHAMVISFTCNGNGPGRLSECSCCAMSPQSMHLIIHRFFSTQPEAACLASASASSQRFQSKCALLLTTSLTIAGDQQNQQRLSLSDPTKVSTAASSQASRHVIHFWKPHLRRKQLVQTQPDARESTNEFQRWSNMSKVVGL